RRARSGPAGAESRPQPWASRPTRGRTPRRRWPRRRSCALAADQIAVALVGQLTAVVHQEAAPTPELVSLHRQHLDAELLVGEVGPGQLEVVRRVRLVDVHARRLGVGAARLQLLDAVFADLDLVTPWRVVVGRHPLSHSQDEREGPFHSLRPGPLDWTRSRCTPRRLGPGSGA